MRVLRSSRTPTPTTLNPPSGVSPPSPHPQVGRAAKPGSIQVRLRQIGRRPAQGLVLLLHQPVTTLQLPQTRPLRGRGARSVAVSTSAACSQFRRHDSLIPKPLAIWAIGASPLRATATTSSRNSLGWGLGRSRHGQHHSSRTPRPHRSNVTYSCSSPELRNRSSNQPDDFFNESTARHTGRMRDPSS